MIVMESFQMRLPVCHRNDVHVSDGVLHCILTHRYDPMKKTIPYQNAHYLTSATSVQQLSPDAGREVAFAGRSNAGKSSALNTITQVHGLARTSKTPGRTQMINFFEITPSYRLVDLPGYGYAKVDGKTKAAWEAMTADYFEQRASLAGLILVMDIRHPLKLMDDQLIAWCNEFNVPLHILLTKADKLKSNEQKKTLFMVEKNVANTATVQLFSSLKKTGVDLARKRLNEWFLFDAERDSQHIHKK